MRELTLRAGECRMLVLSGRAVPGASPLPFRPLTEALLVAGRAGGPPAARELAGFGGQLARLVPDWGAAAPGGADESPVLVGEAVLRLLRVLGGTKPHAGCLPVLEDLQWSDAETLAVVDYLADTVADEPVICLLTTRPEPTASVADVVERIRGRAACTVIRLPVLTADDQHQMVQACLADDAAADEVAAFVVEHSDGVPFLVEELLAGLTASGALRRTGAGWIVQRPLTPAVPTSLAESVRSRLAAFDRDGRQVLGAAAVLGRRFDWDLLPGVANVDGAIAVEALRAAISDQLVVADGRTFRFRHALTREAVLAELLPPERAAVSARALVAVRRAHPDLEGSWCELAAELAEAAGDQADTAALLTESARRALARGALISAEVTARRARHFAPVGSQVVDAVDEVLVRALAAAGKPASARELGTPLVDRLEDGRRRANLALVMARAAIAVGDYTAAATDADGPDGRWQSSPIPASQRGWPRSRETALGEAERAAPGDPRILGDAWGRVRTIRHALREDRARFRQALDASMPFVRAAPPARSVFGGRIYWALLCTMDDDDLGVAARAELHRSRL